MEITEVRIKLMDDPQERLQAFCSITFDKCFVVRDLKIIQGTKGSFVAMPSRKLTDRCPKCHAKNHLRAFFCSQCGAKLDEERAMKCDDGRAKLYADIAHPINSACREEIQERVLEAFELEVVRAQQPDYMCAYDDYGEDNYATLKEPEEAVEAETSVAAVSNETPTPAKPTFFESTDGSTRHRVDPAETNSVSQAPHVDKKPDSAPTQSASTLSDEAQGEDDFGLGL